MTRNDGHTYIHLSWVRMEKDVRKIGCVSGGIRTLRSISSWLMESVAYSCLHGNRNSGISLVVNGWWPNWKKI